MPATAHITKTRDGYELQISNTCRAVDSFMTAQVPDKRTARKVAAELNAKPWNF